MGSCGFKISDEDAIVAIAHGFYDAYPGQTGNPNTYVVYLMIGNLPWLCWHSGDLLSHAILTCCIQMKL